MELNILLKFDIDYEQLMKDTTVCRTIGDIEAIMRHHIAQQVGNIVSHEPNIQLLASAVLDDDLQIKETSKVVLKPDIPPFSIS